MMNNEPAYLEIFLTKLAFRFYGKPVYKTFADCIPICMLLFQCCLKTDMMWYTATLYCMISHKLIWKL